MNEYVHSDEREMYVHSYMRLNICNYVYVCARTVFGCVDAFVCVDAYFHVHYISACLHVSVHVHEQLSGCLTVSVFYTTTIISSINLSRHFNQFKM